jgi:CHASE3 domain sensor protein
MRINAITNWAYGVTVVLTVLSGGAFILSAGSANEERRAVEEHLAFDTLAEELALGAEERSDEARLYVMRGDERHLEAFHGREGEEHRREAAIKNARAQGASPAELAALAEVEQDAEALDKIEAAAIDTYRNGDRAAAQQALLVANTNACRRICSIVSGDFAISPLPVPALR